MVVNHQLSRSCVACSACLAARVYYEFTGFPCQVLTIEVTVSCKQLGSLTCSGQVPICWTYGSIMSLSMLRVLSCRLQLYI